MQYTHTLSLFQPIHAIAIVIIVPVVVVVVDVVIIFGMALTALAYWRQAETSV